MTISLIPTKLSGTIRDMTNASSVARTARATALGLLAFGSLALAQRGPARPAPAGGGVPDALVSPEVHGDRTVTFRLYAPKATDVTLTGDWMATLDSRTGGITKMTKGTDGVWTFTSPPLEPTIHLYFFTLDGLNIADPVNPVLKLPSQYRPRHPRTVFGHPPRHYFYGSADQAIKLVLWPCQ
jgi:hypothetical protein